MVTLKKPKRQSVRDMPAKRVKYHSKEIRSHKKVEHFDYADGFIDENEYKWLLVLNPPYSIPLYGGRSKHCRDSAEAMNYVMEAEADGNY